MVEDRLGKQFSVVIEKCRALGFPVFRGTPPSRMETVWWEDDDWEAFLAAAKAAGAKVIVISRAVADRGEVEWNRQRFSALLKAWEKVAAVSDDDEEISSPPSDEEKKQIMSGLKQGSDHHGQTGFLQAAWIQDGVVYSIANFEDWWDDFSDAEEFLDDAEEAVEMGMRSSPETPKHIRLVKGPQAGMIA